MDDPAIVHMTECLDHLVEEETSDGLAQGAVALAEREECARGDVFKNEECDIFNPLARFLDQVAIVTSFYKARDAVVIQLLHNLNLVFDNGSCLVLIQVQILLLENLERVLLLRLVHMMAQVNPGCLTLSQSLRNRVLVIQNWISESSALGRRNHSLAALGEFGRQLVDGLLGPYHLGGRATLGSSCSSLRCRIHHG